MSVPHASPAIRFCRAECHKPLSSGLGLNSTCPVEQHVPDDAAQRWLSVVLRKLLKDCVCCRDVASPRSQVPVELIPPVSGCVCRRAKSQCTSKERRVTH